MTKPALGLLLLAAALPLAARSSLQLTSGWRFQMDVSDLGEKEGWFNPSFDRHAWATVSVPKAWDLYDESMWGYEGIGWYAYTIAGADTRPGEVQRLRFDRVNYYAKVWLNGQVLGESTNGNLPFEFDISNKLLPDADNILILRVDNRPRDEWLPGTRRIEWVLYGGILGPVTLETLAHAFIEDVTIRAAPTAGPAAISCLVTVRNAGSRPQAVHLRLAVAGHPEVVKVTDLTLRPGSTVSPIVLLELDGAQPWSPESPTLYTLEASLGSSAGPLDATHTRFGVRKIEARGRDILLNGKKVFLRGVNRYDELGKYGPNAPRDVVIQDLRRMKQAGVNLIRVHYPQSPDLISLYDEMGFFMMEEINLCWWEAKDDSILKQALPGLEGLIRRDKNHPAIIIWSMANESKTGTETGIRVMRTLLRRAKELDPTRLATYVTDSHDVQDQRAYEEADIVAVNVYVGQFFGDIAHHIGELETRVRKPTAAFVHAQAKAFPKKPMIISEFGTRGIRGIHGDVDYTEEFQAAFIQSAYAGIRDNAEPAGAVLWCWADYYHRRDFVQYAVFGPYGVVTVDRQPKAALRALATMYGGSVE